MLSFWDCKGSDFSLHSKFFCNFFRFFAFLFQKYEKYGQNQAKEGGKVVPLERLALEHYSCKYCKNCKGYHFLDDFKLHQVERTSVVNKSDSVRRYLCTVLEVYDLLHNHSLVCNHHIPIIIQTFQFRNKTPQTNP